MIAMTDDEALRAACAAIGGRLVPDAHVAGRTGGNALLRDPDGHLLWLTVE